MSLDGLIVEFFFFFFLGGGFLKKTFLQTSVDRVIYRDYIVNRRFFIYCSLACVLWRPCGVWKMSVPPVLHISALSSWRRVC